MTRRTVVVGVGLGLASAAVILMRRNRRRVSGRTPEHAFVAGSSSRTARNMEMASLGTRLGATAASNRAQRVFASAERKQELDTELELKTAEQVAAALGNMKGALMKIGQMASYLDDGLPEPLRLALAELQQDAPPMSPELAAETIAKELGAPPDQVFASWDPKPIAAASIGQVHRAMSHDGRALAVKVQYPGVAEAVGADLDNAGLLTQVLGFAFPGLDSEPLVGELRARLTEELDYSLEAENQRLFADYYAGHPFISIPQVVAEYSTSKVLTSELAEGVRFDEMESWSQHERDLAAETIFRFVFRSLYRLSAFNGDPHPGNYLFQPGGRVTFLDFGLVKHFEPWETDLLQEMVRTMVLEPDHTRFLALVEKAGFLKPGGKAGTDDLVAYYRHFYEMVLDYGAVQFSPEYASETVRRFFDTSGPHADVIKSSNLPPSFVILQRINLGLYALLARLGAKADWRRIAEELWPAVDGPPSTPAGELEAIWLSSK